MPSTVLQHLAHEIQIWQARARLCSCFFKLSEMQQSQTMPIQRQDCNFLIPGWTRHQYNFQRKTSLLLVAAYWQLLNNNSITFGHRYVLFYKWHSYRSTLYMHGTLLASYNPILWLFIYRSLIISSAMAGGAAWFSWLKKVSKSPSWYSHPKATKEMRFPF